MFCIGLGGNVSATAAQNSVPQSKQQINLSFAPLVKQVAPAVVNIYTSRVVTQRVSPFMGDPFFEQFFGGAFGFNGGRGDGLSRQRVSNSLGSGVIVDAGGLVITNAHVIDGADQITVILPDGREFEAVKDVVDARSDLAILRIDAGAETLPVVSIKPSDSLEVGDLVLAIGNPFGVGQTVTSGIVSALARSSLNINDFNFFIQTDAAINPGNSGGPLVAMDGSVIGINTAIYSRSGGSLGIGFAIPSEMVASVIAAAQSGTASIEGQERAVIRPWLGITAQKITADIARSLDMELPRGVLVAALHSESPLRRAGVRVGDVITKINEQEVRDAPELKFRMATVALGERASFEILRKGRMLELNVKAIAPPDEPPRNETFLRGNHPFNGIVVAQINPAMIYEYGLPDEDEAGVMVIDTAQARSFFRVFQRGDVLVSLNGRDIDDIDDLNKALQEPSSAGWEIVLRRDSSEKRLVLR